MNFLKKNNIHLSVAVFRPSTLKYDERDNLQVKNLEKFCENKCKNFIISWSLFLRKKIN